VHIKATSRWPVSNKSNPHPHNLLLIFILISSSHLCLVHNSTKIKFVQAFLISHMPDKCLAHVILHLKALMRIFLTWALDGGEWSASCRGRFNPGENARHPLYRMRGGPMSRSERYGEEKDLLPVSGIQSRLLVVPPVTWLLYRLRYPGSLMILRRVQVVN
jgi:hypothetical protein